MSISSIRRGSKRKLVRYQRRSDGLMRGQSHSPVSALKLLKEAGNGGLGQGGDKVKESGAR
jgi:hypothetical protein